MRGQSLIIDYMAGAFLFLVMFAFFFVIWGIYANMYFSAQARMELDSTVLSVSQSLLSSGGEPVNWTADPMAAKRIGLASRQNVLDWARIDSLSSLSYAEQKIKLGIDRDFVIRIDSAEGARLATIGNEPNSTSRSAEISRFAVLDNKPVRVRLMAYEA
ncbi:MAG: hypothetical protein WC506_03390 [Candidatus Micrarchaeia archaeon]